MRLMSITRRHDSGADVEAVLPDGDAGGVDEQGRAAERARRRARTPPRRRRPTSRRSSRRRSPPDSSASRAALASTSSSRSTQRRPHAVTGERARHREPEPARAAGDDRHLALRDRRTRRSSSVDVVAHDRSACSTQTPGRDFACVLLAVQETLADLRAVANLPIRQASGLLERPRWNDAGARQQVAQRRDRAGHEPAGRRRGAVGARRHDVGDQVALTRRRPAPPCW